MSERDRLFAALELLVCRVLEHDECNAVDCKVIADAVMAAEVLLAELKGTP